MFKIEHSFYPLILRVKVRTRCRAEYKNQVCYSPPPLKESRPEIRSESLLRVEKHVTHVHISDNHQAVLSEGEFLRIGFL
jgi:hypothetical protein